MGKVRDMQDNNSAEFFSSATLADALTGDDTRFEVVNSYCPIEDYSNDPQRVFLITSKIAREWFLVQKGGADEDSVSQPLAKKEAEESFYALAARLLEFEMIEE